jgi:hypothetical protein
MMPGGGGNKADKGKKDEEIPLDKPLLAVPKKFHKGGRVRKSGWAKVKKGERVLTKKQAKKLKRKRD